MRIGVLGTGIVGKTIGGKLVELGHEVRIGSRSAGGDAATEWVAEAGDGASEGTFADAAAFGEVVFNCTPGMHAAEALGAAGAENLAGKTVVDVSNALDFSGGRPPTLGIVNTTSVGEELQKAFPDARIVKSLNTMNAGIMVDPGAVPGDHVVFVCGDDEGAKDEARALLGEFGWPAERIVDVGGIIGARGTEMWLPLWLELMGSLGTAQFNIAVVKA
jgi:8-hydroxy-5-deazaflavin:NADPH oxidoreductase